MTLKLGQGQKMSIRILFIPIIDAKFHYESPSWIRKTARKFGSAGRKQTKNNKFFLKKWWVRTIFWFVPSYKEKPSKIGGANNRNKPYNSYNHPLSYIGD